jgi:hypothetical protein
MVSWSCCGSTPHHNHGVMVPPVMFRFEPDSVESQRKRYAKWEFRKYGRAKVSTVSILKLETLRVRLGFGYLATQTLPIHFHHITTSSNRTICLWEFYFSMIRYFLVESHRQISVSYQAQRSTSNGVSLVGERQSGEGSSGIPAHVQ